MPRRDRCGVADLVLADHPVDLGDAEAADDEVLLGRLERLLAGDEVGRTEDVHGLVGEPVGEVQPAEVGHHARPQAGLLRELAAGELLRVAVDALPGALRELPEALPHRVAVLLDQPHRVVLDRHDQRRRGLLDPAVQAAALQPVLVHPHPAVLVDDPGRNDAHERAA